MEELTIPKALILFGVWLVSYKLMGVHSGKKHKTNQEMYEQGGANIGKEKGNNDERIQKEETLAATLKKRDKDRRKKERFLTARMWISTFISFFFTDRGTIPPNIGNNILVTNNLVITKNHLTAYIQIREMSEATPIAWTSDLLQSVRDQVPGVLIDFTFKSVEYHPDLTPSNINGRVKTWHQMMDNPFMPEPYVRRAARMLYTLDVARSGVSMYKEYIYIMVRAKDGGSLKRGVAAVSMYLNGIGCQFRRINSKLDEHLNFQAMISNMKPSHIKDYPGNIFSTQTLAESLPVTQGGNDTKGQLMGYDAVSHYPYFIDFRSSSAAKNIMIEALSGWGKSFIATYWLYPFYADGFNLSVMDIKGNEFAGMTKALNGIRLSMRSTSTHYINTFLWRKNEVFDGDYRTYANERFRMSKERMLCICDLNQKETSHAESLLEEFLQFVYMNIGAIPENTNTWERTEQLNPYVIYDMFARYVSHEIHEKYSAVVDKMLERLRIYMWRKGSRAHMYRHAYSYLDVLETRCLTYDFGLLDGAGTNDPVCFHLHVLDMQCINDAYVSYKKSKKEWTLAVLEESQVVDDWLTKAYARDITLRRSMNQVTALLGNSVAALAANPLSRPIVENMNILCLGSLNKSSRDYLINEFGLKPVEAKRLDQIQTDPDFQRKFLLINRMQKNSTTAILEANVPPKVSESSLFKIVDTEGCKTNA